MILIYFQNAATAEKQQMMLSHVFALAKRELPFRVLLPSDLGEVPRLLKERGIEYDVIKVPVLKRSTQSGAFRFIENALSYGLYVIGYFYYMKKISRFYKMYPFAIVHSTDTSANILSIILKIRFNSVLIWSLLGFFKNRLRQFAFQRLASIFCDHLVSSSRRIAQQMDRTHRWREHLSVLHPGIEVERIEPNLLDLKKMAECPVVAMAERCSLHDASGYRLFLRILELFRRDQKNVRGVLFLFGNRLPEKENEIRNTIEQMGLVDIVEVHFIDHTFEAGTFSQEYAKCGVNIFIHPGVSFELQDMALTDAVLSGIPVVCGRDAEISEYFMHGQTALLAEAGNAQAFVEELKAALRDCSHTRMRAELARKEFLTRFASQVIEAHFEKIYQKYVEAVLAEDSDKKEAA